MVGQLKNFCAECGGSFGYLDRANDHPNTCSECMAKLRPASVGECDWCSRVIQIGEKYHMFNVKVCEQCVIKVPEDDRWLYDLNCKGW